MFIYEICMILRVTVISYSNRIKQLIFVTRKWLSGRDWTFKNYLGDIRTWSTSHRFTFLISQRRTFSSRHLPQKDERAVPGNLQSRKFVFPVQFFVFHNPTSTFTSLSFTHVQPQWFGRLILLFSMPNQSFFWQTIRNKSLFALNAYLCYKLWDMKACNI